MGIISLVLEICFCMGRIGGRAAMQRMEEENWPQGVQPGTAQVMMVASPPGQTLPNQAQSSQVLLVVSSSQMETPIDNKKAKALLYMGSVQLIIGILEVLFNIGATVMMVVISSIVGPGYWCGLFAILAGCFGIAAGWTKGKCMTITFMVLSIIAAVFTVSIIAVAAIGIVESPDNYYYRIYTNDDYSYNYNSYHKTYSYDKGKVDASIAWNSLLLIAGVAELFIAIISSTLCCGALCGNSQPSVMHPGVQYLNGAQHLNVNGQVGMATNWFPPPTQATAPVQAHPDQQPINNVQQHMMNSQPPAYVATNGPPPPYQSNKY